MTLLRSPHQLARRDAEGIGQFAEGFHISTPGIRQRLQFRNHAGADLRSGGELRLCQRRCLPALAQSRDERTAPAIRRTHHDKCTSVTGYRSITCRYRYNHGTMIARTMTYYTVGL